LRRLAGITYIPVQYQYSTTVHSVFPQQH